MPYKSKYPCANSRCPNLINSGKYCKLHDTGEKKKDKRASAFKRGYNTEWAKVRKMVLKNSPICEECGKNKSTVAHHIPNYKPGTSHKDYDYNALCEWCHNRITGKR